LAGIVPDAGPETPAGEERGAAGLGRFRWMGGGARASRALAVKRHLEHLVTQLTHGERARRCLFVSLTGGEGKTFLIARLAATANRMGLKVLLVDADGDRPALHRAFQKPIAPGFGEWEEGTADAAEIVLHATAGTDVICAGAVHAPLLRHASVARVGETLKRLAEAYDLVLIDTGALRRDPSAVRLLPLADEIVCVFDATSSLLDDVETVGDRIAGVAAQVRCVLNRVRHEPDYLFGSENGHPSMTVAEAELAGLTAARSEAESGDQTVL
jgi:non-specific protein-tyrosine kinase